MWLEREVGGGETQHNAFPSNASSEMHAHELFLGNSEQKKVEEWKRLIKSLKIDVYIWPAEHQDFHVQ